MPSGQYQLKTNDDIWKLLSGFDKSWSRDLVAAALEVEKLELVAFIVNCPLSSAD